MLHILMLIYVLLFLGAAYNKYKSGSPLELLPTCGWLALMALPYWLQEHSFVDLGKNAQIFSILFIGFCLLASDYFAIHFKQKHPPRVSNSDRLMTCVSISLVIIIVFWVIHLISMPTIPYFQELMGETDSLRLAVLRENASKLLDVPIWFIYFCQIFATISPVFIILLLKQKKYILGTSFLFCVYIYTHATLAKGPYLIFMFLMIILGYRTIPNKYKLLSLKACATLALLGVGWTLYICTTNYELSPFLYKHTDSAKLEQIKDYESSDDLSFTYGDNFRLLSNREYYFDLDKYIQYPIFLVYRMVLVPVEVSHRWYVYYPHKNNGFLGFDGLTPASRNAENFQHASNIVGRWAFQKRFPQQYLDSVHAYASVDADAFSRWGYIGIIIIGLILFGIRIFLRWLNDGSQILDLFYLTALAVLAVNLPAASIQAILAAQGLFAIIAIMSLICLIAFIKHKSSLKKTSTELG